MATEMKKETEPADKRPRMTKRVREDNRSRINNPNNHNNNKLLKRFEEVVSQPQLFYATLEDLHRTMHERYRVPAMVDVKLDLHTVFVEVISRGGIEKVKKEGRLKEVCDLIGNANIREPGHLSDIYYEFQLNEYERQDTNDQAIESINPLDARTTDTTRTIPKCVSFPKKSSFKRPKPVEKGRTRAFLRSKGLPEFLFSEKRNSFTSPLQVNVKLGTALQDIPEFLYSDNRRSSRNRILNILELKQKGEGEREDGVVAEGFGPQQKFSHGNCDPKIKHAKAQEWGRVLSLAVGDSSFEVLSKTGQIDDDKVLDPFK